MSGYQAETYGDAIADVYDRLYETADPAMIDVLAEYAGAGPALELGIGTGRIALPLTARGVEVHGMDSSEAMVAKLRAKPGGETIPVTIGDFRSFELDARFKLVYVPFNTFFALQSQDEQLQCFRTVAAHLENGGHFLLELFVPDPKRFTDGQRVAVSRLDAQGFTLDVGRHDPVTQRVESHHVQITGSGIELIPVQVRYAWPAELDLMARLAGLSLRARWADWHRRPFDASSTAHISVYGRA